MKKLLCMILLVLMLISLSSCTSKIELSKYITNDKLEPSELQLKLDGDVRSIAVYKNIAFVLNNGNVIRYDIITGKSEVVVEDLSALAIGCDGSSIAAVSKDYVSVYDYDGKMLTTISIEKDASEIVDVAVSDKYVMFVNRDKSKDEIYCADIRSKKVSVLPDDWKAGKDNASVKRISITAKGTLLISYCYDFNLAGSSFKVLEYNVAKKAVGSSLHAKDTAQNGCFGTDGEFYYMKGYCMAGFGAGYFISKLLKDGSLSNIMFIDNDSLTKPRTELEEVFTGDLQIEGDESAIAPIIMDYCLLEYSDGENFVVWNKTAGILSALCQNTDITPLVFIISDENDVHMINELIVAYTMKTGRQVVLKTYPEKDYNKRMLTKIMADDEDYDLFISDEVMLNSILDHSSYEPLDDYPKIIDNLDNVYATGVKNLMTADNGVFGIPLSVNLSGTLELLDNSYSLPDYPTVEDLFALCDSLEGSNKKVFKDRAMLMQTTTNIVEEMIQKNGEINNKELSEYFGKLKSYNDMGVLCDGDKEHIMSWGTLMFNYFQDMFKLNRIDERHIVTSPIAGETQYLTLGSTILINRNSQNKEAAAEFIAMLSSEEVVYNNECGLLIGKDITKNSDYATFSEKERDFVNYSMKIYDNSKPAKLGVIDDFTQYINEVTNLLFDGEITPEQATKKVSHKVSYVYFE